MDSERCSNCCGSSIFFSNSICIVLFAAAILSWLIVFNVVNTRNHAVAMIGEFLYRVTEPVLQPIRKRLPNFGGIDISFIVCILIIIFIQWSSSQPRPGLHLVPDAPRPAMGGMRRWLGRHGAPHPEGRPRRHRGRGAPADGRCVLKARVAGGARPRARRTSALARLFARAARRRAARDCACRRRDLARQAAADPRRCPRRRGGARNASGRRPRNDRDADRRKGRCGRACAPRSPPRCGALRRRTVSVPGLAVVLVGHNPASEAYVGSKTKMMAEAGMRSFDHRLPATASEAELLALIARLNARSGRARHPGATAAAAADRSPQRDRGGRPGQGRRRIPSAQCRAAGARAAGARAVHAARMHHARQDRARLARRARCVGDRPLRSSSAGRSPSFCSPETRRSRSRIRRPGTCRRCAGGPTSWWPRSAVPRW